MRLPLIPREEKFFDMFDKVGEIVCRAAHAFAELVERFDRLELRARELREMEHECDLAIETILTALGRTFITPLDREDIHNLATSLDDVLDNLEEAAYRLTSFRISQPTPAAINLALIVRKCCEHVQTALKLCRKGIGSDDLNRVLREISRLENEADDIFRNTEAELFAKPPEIMEFIKLREVYAWLENTVDSCRDVAHVLNEIVIKGS